MLQYVNRDFSRKIWRWFYYARLPIFGLPPAYPQPPPSYAASAHHCPVPTAHLASPHHNLPAVHTSCPCASHGRECPLSPTPGLPLSPTVPVAHVSGV